MIQFNFHWLVFIFLVWENHFSFLVESIACNSIPENEVEALHNLYNSTYGVAWKWRTDEQLYGIPWNFNLPNPDPCTDSWQGITCDSDNCHIITLFLENYGLNGTLPGNLAELTELQNLWIVENPLLRGSIPPSIATMSQLEGILLYENTLEGSIPASIGNLTNLVDLELYDNFLSGTIPESITMLKNLKILYLGNNYRLLGSIPVNIGNLTSLTELQLYSNLLTGPIPNSVTSLVSLEWLLLSSNELTGTIPANLGDMTSLNQFQIDQNFLHGSIPDSICNLAKLHILYLLYNQLSGAIPNNIGELISLGEFEGEYNFLTGTIPDSITKLAYLDWLYLNNNYLNGSIPVYINDMTSLSELELGSNFLTNQIPDSITLLPALKWLLLWENLLTGPIPEDIGSMTSLVFIELYSNQLSKTIPKSITGLVKLQTLYLSNNYLTGPIPEDIGNLILLSQLELNYNLLTNTIPTSVTSLTKLTWLYLSYNKLNGTIPSTIGNMQGLTQLQLTFNYLTGSLPESLTLLENLEILYLSDNHLTGSIPSSINNLTALVEIEINSNLFNGSIPSSITQLQSLRYLDLCINFFSGKIPIDIGNMTSLTQLQLYTNHLTGPIPESIINLVNVEWVYLNDNELVGSIPPNIGNLTKMTELQLFDNFLTGRIPNSISSIEYLERLIISENSFTGTIPSSIGQLLYLAEFQLNSNQLTGPIPDSIVLLISLEYLFLSNNLLTGSIPQNIDYLPLLQQLYLYDNYFTGLIPNSISSLSILQQFEIYNNWFSGQIGDLFTKLAFIQVLQIQSNLFSGKISNLLNWQNSNVTLVIDVSDNSFSGPIPSDLFILPRLNYFAAVKNCFTGSIPSSVCSRNQTLSTLVLDGLHSSSTCQERIFPHTALKTYSLNYALTGTIPECLFTEMKLLETLHISGNGLGGSLPSKVVSSNLTELSLSHNTLTGTIPVNFQEHSWEDLDLSFNRLTGVLSNSIDSFTSVNASLTLDVNRLSGKIPASVQNAPDINILSGNIFFCGENKRGLPRHDSNYDSYVCGSDSVNDAMFVYLAVLGTILIFALIFSYQSCSKALFQHTTKLKNLIILAVPRDSVAPREDLQLFEKSLHVICRWIIQVAIGIVFIFMFLYGILGIYYSSYVHKYAWKISIGYLTGQSVGIILFLVMITAFSFLMIRKYDDDKIWIGYLNSISLSILSVENTQQSENDSICTDEANNVNNLSDTLSWFLVRFILLLFLNITIVVVVNGVYVYLIVSNTVTDAQIVLTICMSLFKTSWRYFCMLCSEWRIGEEFEIRFGRDLMMKVLCWICIFNNIIAPCLASLFVNVNCFYYAIIPEQDIQTDVCHTYCDGFIVIGYDATCATYETSCLSTSFQPAFSYNYLCSSSLLATYADVWLYMFLFSGIIFPCCSLLLLSFFANNSEQLISWKNFILMTMSYKYYPKTWLEEEIIRHSNTTSSSAPLAPPAPRSTIAPSLFTFASQGFDAKRYAKFIFNAKRFVVLQQNNIVIILTVGILFPPIAIAGCIAVCMQCMIDKLYVIRILSMEEGENSKASSSSLSISPTPTAVSEKVEEGQKSDGEKSPSENWSLFLTAISMECRKLRCEELSNLIQMCMGMMAVVWSMYLWEMMGDQVGWKASIWVLPVLITLIYSLRSISVYQQRKLNAIHSKPEKGTSKNKPLRSSEMIELQRSTIGAIKNPIINEEIESS